MHSGIETQHSTSVSNIFELAVKYRLTIKVSSQQKHIEQGSKKMPKEKKREKEKRNSYKKEWDSNHVSLG